jgi:hypothetical protein
MFWTLVSGVIALVATVIGARPVGHALKTKPVVWYRSALVAAAVIATAVILVGTVINPSDAGTSQVLQGVGIGLGYKGLFELASGRDRS